jgi:hypothetical protein
MSGDDAEDKAWAVARREVLYGNLDGVQAWALLRIADALETIARSADLNAEHRNEALDAIAGAIRGDKPDGAE